MAYLNFSFLFRHTAQSSAFDKNKLWYVLCEFRDTMHAIETYMKQSLSGLVAEEAPAQVSWNITTIMNPDEFRPISIQLSTNRFCRYSSTTSFLVFFMKLSKYSRSFSKRKLRKVEEISQYAISSPFFSLLK